MPDFRNAFRDGRRVSPAPGTGAVRWAMEASGYQVATGAVWTPVWFLPDAGDYFEGARLVVTNRDGEAADTYDVQLWSQEAEQAGGLKLAEVSVASVAATLGVGVSGTVPREVVEVGARSRGWGVRARMTGGTPARHLSFMLTLFCRMPSSGLLWRGEGVT